MTIDWRIPAPDLLTADTTINRGLTDTGFYVLVEIPPTVPVGPENTFRDYGNVPLDIVRNFGTRYADKLTHPYYCGDQPNCGDDTKIARLVALFPPATVLPKETDLTPPTVALNSPLPNAGFYPPETIDLSVTAEDAVGISKVEFLLDGTVFASDPFAPYTCSWPITSLEHGTHTWSARAYDWVGNSALSQQSMVQVRTDDAAFVSQTIPALMNTESKATVSVTMRNTGSVPWTIADNDKLGAQAPQDNRRWGAGRVLLRDDESVAPGTEKTFTWTTVAPSTPGAYNFQWRMVRDRVHWFGQQTPLTSVTVVDGTPPTAPSGVAAMEKERSFELTWGTSTDKGGSGVARYRVDVSTSATFSEFVTGWENQEVLQSITVTGMTPETRYFARLRAEDGAGNVSPPSESVSVLIPRDPWGARFISQKVPARMTAGGKYLVSITVENRGLSPWTSMNNTFLGSPTLSENVLWLDPRNQVSLDPTETVAPGELKTFKFIVTAPFRFGPARFQWQMMNETKGEFGPLSEVLSIQVKDPAAVGGIDATALTPPEMRGRLFVGYQGWFQTPSDGTGGGWGHWGFAPLSTGNKSTTLTVDMWPDVSEYPSSVLSLLPSESVARLGNGNPSQLFSSSLEGTTDVHLRWMKENGIDGAFVQRSVTGIRNPSSKTVLINMLQSADRYAQKIVVVYDISGAWLNPDCYVNGGKPDSALGSANPEFSINACVRKDWESLETLATAPSAALHVTVDGVSKPLVGLWGFGLNNPATAGTSAPAGSRCIYNTEDGLALIEWFKSRGVALMGGTPAYWRTQTGDALSGDYTSERRWPSWTQIYQSFDLISPWMVGRVDKEAGVDLYVENTLRNDIAAVAATGQGYLPVIFPGYSSFNTARATGLAYDSPSLPLNQIPRNCGTFFWKQFAAYRKVGLHSMYVAMFDEMNTGTAILKMAPSAETAPRNASLVTLDMESDSLPSDWYLQVAHKMSQTLEGAIPLSETLPLALPPKSVARGMTLLPNKQVRGPGVRLIFQADGNLVLYDTLNKPLWNSQTAGRECSSNCQMSFQEDGNLVLYDHGRAYWASHTGQDQMNGLVATNLILLDHAPYLEIRGESHNTLWSSAMVPMALEISAPKENSALAGTTRVIVLTHPSAVQRVEVSIDGNPPTVLGTAPYQFDLNAETLTHGTHTIEATAYDAAGHWAQSQIRVSRDPIAPTVSITIPTSGATFAAPQTVELTATAEDNREVARVEFFLDGALYRSDTLSPYTATWLATGKLAGSHRWTAKAFDAAGNQATSGPVLLTIKSDEASFVSQTVPTEAVAGQPFLVSVTLKNTGSDPWTRSGGYKLGSQNPQDNTRWGMLRVLLPLGESVAPGTDKTFSFTAIAPSTLGESNFQWQMVREGVRWFGALTVNKVIKVVAPRQPLANIPLRSIPLTIDGARAYPIPFQPGHGAMGITFDQIPAETPIRIYTTDGRPIKRLTTNTDGWVQWNLTNDEESPVASGVYLAIIEKDGGRKRLKVVVQK